MEKKVNDIAIHQMKALRKAGHSIRAIAERFKLHSNTVANYTREFSKPRTRYNAHMEQHIIDEIKELYRYGLEASEIAAELGLNKNTVKRHIRPLEAIAEAEPVPTKREGPQAMHRFDCLNCAASLNWWLNPDDLLRSWQRTTKRCEHCGREYRAHQVIPYANLQLPEDAINTSY